VTRPSWTIELLPIFLDAAGAIRWLARTEGGAWHAPQHDGLSPHDVTLAALKIFGVGPFVAHSTSWRFDRELILTYLVLLPSLHAPPPEGFEVRAVGRESLARGDLAAPPPEIGVTQVLEHALRHLAWLSSDDPAIRALLGQHWLNALRVYQPEPFRSIQDLVITHS
jgi:hypothetical protein